MFNFSLLFSNNNKFHIVQVIFVLICKEVYFNQSQGDVLVTSH